jgi:TetR/AcrR family transcriptional regulator, lmrAB and yxaGH operons repressor
MPPHPPARQEIVETLFEVFRREGFDGASLSSISQATGLGRSSLYHYFPGGKRGMALAVLDHVEGWFANRIAEPSARETPAQDRIDTLLVAVDELYKGGTASCLLERLLASVDHDAFQSRLAPIFAAWTTTLAGVLIDGGVPTATASERAEDAIARIEGALIVCAATGSAGAFRRALDDLLAHLLDVE